MKQDKHDMQPTVSARRRLIRGAFGAPALMALTSGSAIAASSTLRCFNNSATGVDTPETSNLFKVQRYTVVISSVTTKLVKAVDIASLGTVNGFSTSPYVTGKTWINVATGADFPVGTAVPLAETSPLKMVALRFTNVGSATVPAFSVSGLANTSTSGSGSGQVMWASCWTSVKPTP